MDVIFQNVPVVQLASNTIINCPTILQLDETPLLEMVTVVKAGYTIRFPVFDSSGTQLAVVVGARIIPTEDGKNAKITQRHEPNLVVCELEGKPILELRKTGAAALKGAAELYAPGGYLVKASDASVAALTRGGQALQINGTTMQGCMVSGAPIGILVARFGDKVGIFLGANWPLPPHITQRHMKPENKAT